LLTPAAEELGKVWSIAWKAIKLLMIQAVQLGKDIYDGWVLMANYVKQNWFPKIRDAFEGWVMILNKVLGFVNQIISALKYALSLLTKVAGAMTGGGGASKGANYGAQFKAGEGFNNGGGFKVGGTGAGRDTTPVAFRANRGERVTVETKKQQRANDNAANQNGATTVNVPLNVINVFDPNMVPAAMDTVAGQRSVINVLKANRDEIAAVLGVN
jgi:hypothetical protein